MEEILSKLGNSVYSIAERLVFAIIIAVVGAILIKLVKRIFKRKNSLIKIDPTARRFVHNFSLIGLETLIIISIIAVLGVPMASIVAVLASAGLAIGMALQGSLSNLAGGIMIAILKPFSLGDYIEAGDVSGSVTDISVFYTSLCTADNKKVVIPNGSLMSSNITNYTSESTRRIDIKISAAYGTDIGMAISVLENAAQQNILVLKDPAPCAYLNNNGDSSLEFVLRVWCKNADYWTVFYALNKSVNIAFTSNGIDIPFPQMDVHIKQN